FDFEKWPKFCRQNARPRSYQTAYHWGQSGRPVECLCVWVPRFAAQWFSLVVRPWQWPSLASLPCMSIPVSAPPVASAFAPMASRLGTARLLLARGYALRIKATAGVSSCGSMIVARLCVAASSTLRQQQRMCLVLTDWRALHCREVDSQFA